MMCVVQAIAVLAIVSALEAKVHKISHHVGGNRTILLKADKPTANVGRSFFGFEGSAGGLGTVGISYGSQSSPPYPPASYNGGYPPASYNGGYPSTGPSYQGRNPYPGTGAQPSYQGGSYQPSYQLGSYQPSYQLGSYQPNNQGNGPKQNYPGVAYTPGYPGTGYPPSYVPNYPNVPQNGSAEGAHRPPCPFGEAAVQCYTCGQASLGFIGKMEQMILQLPMSIIRGALRIPARIIGEAINFARALLPACVRAKDMLLSFLGTIFEIPAQILMGSVNMFLKFLYRVAGWGDGCEGQEYCKRPLPVFNGLGPCGGQWPCKETVACTTDVCYQASRALQDGKVHILDDGDLKR